MQVKAWVMTQHNTLSINVFFTFMFRESLAKHQFNWSCFTFFFLAQFYVKKLTDCLQTKLY